ncbi:MAG: DEAD/DEAH box helicase [Clostridia bacterium]
MRDNIMLLDQVEMNMLLRRAEDKVSGRGMKLYEKGKVSTGEFIKYSQSKYTAISIVDSANKYIVKIDKDSDKIDYSCDCQYFDTEKKICEHIVAMIFDLYTNEDKYLNYKGSIIDKKKSISLTGKRDTNLVMDFISYYETMELQKLDNKSKYNHVRITPKVKISGKNFSVSFKLGTEKEYILKDIYKFSEALKNKECVKYGKDLEFIHIKEAFEKDSLQLMKFIDKKATEYNELIDVYNSQGSVRGKINLVYSALDEFFEIAKDMEIEVEETDAEKTEEVKFIKFLEQDPVLKFVVSQNDKKLEITHNYMEYKIYKGQNSIYILKDYVLYKCSDEFKNAVIPAINSFRMSKKEVMKITKDRISSFCGYVLPILNEKAEVIYDEKIVEGFLPEKLAVKVFLDLDKYNNIIAEIKFCYGDIEFNPYSDLSKVECNRNSIEELKVRNIFKQHGFSVNYEKQYIYLKEESDIYNFIKEGIEDFMAKFEVLITEKLKNRQIISTKKISMGVRIENNLLSVSVEDLGLTEAEIKQIFKLYKMKKKYFRLKDGSFLNFESAGISALVDLSDTLGVNEKELVDGKIQVEKYRALSLDNFIKENDSIDITRDETFKNVIKDVTSIKDEQFKEPKCIEGVLRNYQKTGFNWLKTLDKCGFGGILADDMGLGKTIQIISLLIDEKQHDKQTSIVVCPSSLYINWKKEINKFAPYIDILVVSGNAKNRSELIKTSLNYDVVITSYDLLKRDIEEYEKVNFKYCIADEAQYIKNNNTQNAKALKRINSSVRFALTGTPMENSLSELWSIFDFVMPGYLYGYRKFRDIYEQPIVKDNDTYSMTKLKKMVSPFILRRMKKDVLSELPEKTESVLYNEMNEKQTALYKAHLAGVRKEVNEELKDENKSGNKIKILSMITRLRQLCCHPSLFIDDYDGESEKLNQCLEIIVEGANSGHKILLFSQFTSMFPIIEKNLKEKNINFLTLTGQTKVDERIEMVEEFNRSKELSVFLISLKAGGTGLNLTGADMVIHYDPWWNVSAQNQATDRAYRIGQKNNVQVFKLITQNSIEEKIQQLQEKKNDLSTSIIKEGETFINKMSRSEILELFDI